MSSAIVFKITRATCCSLVKAGSKPGNPVLNRPQAAYFKYMDSEPYNEVEGDWSFYPKVHPFDVESIPPTERSHQIWKPLAFFKSGKRKKNKKKKRKKGKKKKRKEESDIEDTPKSSKSKSSLERNEAPSHKSRGSTDLKKFDQPPSHTRLGNLDQPKSDQPASRKSISSLNLLKSDRPSLGSPPKTKVPKSRRLHRAGARRSGRLVLSVTVMILGTFLFAFHFIHHVLITKAYEYEAWGGVFEAKEEGFARYMPLTFYILETCMLIWLLVIACSTCKDLGKVPLVAVVMIAVCDFGLVLMRILDATVVGDSFGGRDDSDDNGGGGGGEAPPPPPPPPPAATPAATTAATAATVAATVFGRVLDSVGRGNGYGRGDDDFDEDLWDFIHKIVYYIIMDMCCTIAFVLLACNFVRSK